MNIEKHRERRKAYWTEYIDHVRSIGHHMPSFEEFLIAKLDTAGLTGMTDVSTEKQYAMDKEWLIEDIHWAMREVENGRLHGCRNKLWQIVDAIKDGRYEYDIHALDKHKKDE